MLKFDTRDKKPKVYNILICCMITAAAVGILLSIDAQRFSIAACCLIDVCLLCVLVMLLVAFFRQMQYNPYSYNTIYYIGFALVVLSVLAMSIIGTVRMIFSVQTINLETIIGYLQNSAKLYMLLSFPFVLVFSAGLCVSNIALIRHEGFSPVNALGILLSFLMLAGDVFLFFADYYVSGSMLYVMIHELVISFFATLYLYFECMLFGTVIADVIAARHEPETDKDFIIILGCGLRADGTPTPLLRGRIDRAIAFAEKQKAATGKDVIFVTSGGQGADEVISESAAMRRYLMEQGVPESRIIEEDRSTNTLENMRFSKEKIDAVNPNGRVLFSTTNYHVFRSGLQARRVKMRALGIGAPTKWYFWPNAGVREFAGLLTAHRGKQALVLGGMILLYVLLTLLEFLYY